jgi:hypothetical protein|tara:strand:+ start:6687 stop:6902 length:216 start_codon:yes stop_codon:yes gene_type:complete
MVIGDFVRYVRAIPEEAHFVFEVAAVLDDDDGSWVMLVEEDEEVPDGEVSPGVMGGFGGWEESKEFEVTAV